MAKISIYSTVVLPDHRCNDASYLELCLGSDDGIFRIGSFQDNLLPCFLKYFMVHSPSTSAITTSPILRLLAFLDDDQIPFHDSFADHGITADLQQERTNPVL